jgi:hypothetical protein
VTFLRQLALLLPSAFLLGALLFLLTHGHGDPGFAVYPFFEQRLGASVAGWTPEVRFLAQAGFFFVPLYALTLLLVAGVSAAERAAFPEGASRRRSAYRRAFAAIFSVLFLIASGAITLWADRALSRSAPGAPLAPVVAALAPFGAGAAALIPAAALAWPAAAIRRAGEA